MPYIYLTYKLNITFLKIDFLKLMLTTKTTICDSDRKLGDLHRQYKGYTSTVRVQSRYVPTTDVLSN